MTVLTLPIYPQTNPAKKPDEQFYRILIRDQRLDPKETLMIGNDPKCDIEGAAAVGFDTCYIHSDISP